MNQNNINVVPAKETNSLRDKVKDAIDGSLLKYLGEDEDMTYLKYSLASGIFEALEISEAGQDIEGAKVIIDKPFCVMCPKCEHGFMTDESLESEEKEK